jgi:hypothetical protein
MTGATTGGRAASAGSPAAGGGCREFGSHFGITGTHQSCTVGFITFRTFYCRVTAKYQFFKICTAVVAMKFKDGHGLVYLLKIFNPLKQL